MLGKILKFRLNRCFCFLPIHILKLEMSGCDNKLLILPAVYNARPRSNNHEESQRGDLEA
jgi:hypothetical protein